MRRRLETTFTIAQCTHVQSFLDQLLRTMRARRRAGLDPIPWFAEIPFRPSDNR
jgi:hypothetical protein